MKNRYLLFLLGTLISILGVMEIHPIIAEPTGETKPTITPSVDPDKPMETLPVNPTNPTETLPVNPTNPTETLPVNPTNPTETPPVNPTNPTGTTTTEPSKDEIIKMKEELKKALQAQKWEDADQITYKLMLLAAGSTSYQNGRFDEQEWSSENFNCSLLKEIDQAWVTETKGWLGYSAQRRVFEKSNQNPLAFYNAIGWKQSNPNKWLVVWKYNPETKEVEYDSIKKPSFQEKLDTIKEGHLPAKLEWTDDKDRRFEKIYLCDIQNSKF